MKQKYITVHCSATRPNQDIGVDQIRKEHKAKGWSDIGYHFVITQGAEIQYGRPLTRTGAHVQGYNKGNIGICLVGGLDKKGYPSNTYSELQMSALRYLITELIGVHGIKQENIKGHRDWYGDTNGDGVIDKHDWMKECPCFNVKEWL
jgi:N-acetylmuramoyl-L-alanine amidase